MSFSILTKIEIYGQVSPAKVFLKSSHSKGGKKFNEDAALGPF